ncbi:DUF4846 domain-containing protein [Botryobacter ruber]|uniref:DUF4846 domain-containing protein n=1 Tax=Botryobacter ruber TaxID=2171629 RepID=UPI000E0C4155|nr:DUF4846 domain-containing protein [Botryobacter ruber]
MLLRYCLYVLLSCCLCACTSRAEQVQETITPAATAEVLVNPEGATIAERFRLPKGFTRVSYPQGSFASYLRSFPLKPHGAVVHYYDGTVKANDGVYEAVLDIDVGKQNLQQCADAIMRLRAEHLYQQQQYDSIRFNFNSGFRADYATWRQGNRIQVRGNTCSWIKRAAPATTYASFKEYLQLVFTYAGTLSLEKELKPVQVTALQAGDVFIKGGSPGHAVVVVDAAVNPATGEKLFLLAQSYMPAQEIHILRNPMDPDKSPWYSTRFGKQLFTPEWTFNQNQLRRF